MMIETDLIIETDRLKIFPLNIEQLEKYLRNDNSLEKELMLKKSYRKISDELREALAITIIPTILDKPDDYLFSTLWSIVHKIENKIIAGITLMKISGSDGEIEIGYGTDDDYQNKGYMTEAVGGIVSWAMSKPGIKRIIASTEKNNPASHIVLIKNNFVKFNDSGTMICWKYELTN